MHIVLLNQFFPPSQAPTGLLLRDLAVVLQERGHAVTVITSAGAYAGERAEVDAGAAAGLSDGIRVVRLGRAGPRRRGLAAKLWHYAAFYWKAGQVLGGLTPVPALVVSMTTPPFCGLLAARLRRRRGVPYVLWCMDLYPEALVAQGWLRSGSLVHRWLMRLARSERAGAARVVALGPDMAGRLRGATDRVVEIPAWSGLVVTPAAEAEARRLRRARGWLDEDLVLMYSGNMGRAHAVTAFRALAERLRAERPQVRMVFCGDGPSRAAWQRLGGGDFEWLEPVAAVALVPHLLAADIHLVSQGEGWAGVVVPSKYAAACAVGRPVIVAGPGDSSVNRWVREADSGWVLPAGDGEALGRVAAAIRERAGICQKGRRAAEQGRQRFAAGALRALLVELIEEVGSRES